MISEVNATVEYGLVYYNVCWWEGKKLDKGVASKLLIVGAVEVQQNLR